MTTSRLPVIFQIPNVLARVFRAGVTRTDPPAAIDDFRASLAEKGVTQFPPSVEIATGARARRR